MTQVRRWSEKELLQFADRLSSALQEVMREFDRIDFLLGRNDDPTGTDGFIEALANDRPHLYRTTENNKEGAVIEVPDHLTTDDVRDAWVDYHLNGIAGGSNYVPHFQEAFHNWLKGVRVTALADAMFDVAAPSEPLLGLATTEELFREIIARFTVPETEAWRGVRTRQALALAEMLGGLTSLERGYRTSAGFSDRSDSREEGAPGLCMCGSVRIREFDTLWLDDAVHRRDRPCERLAAAPAAQAANR